MATARLPIDEVRDLFERRPYYFDAIDLAAEAFYAELMPSDDLAGAIKQWLQKTHGIVVRSLPIYTMPNLRRRFDRHSMRLFLSERLSQSDQLREIAMEACLLALHGQIDKALGELSLSGQEAQRIARFELARYAAHALMMPYAAFYLATQRARYDIDVLRSRFNVSYEQVSNRLVSLVRSKQSGIPFFMLEIDNAGNVFRRAGARGFPHARFGGRCPRLNVHAVFGQPGQILSELARMPDEQEFLTVSRTLDGPQAGYGERVRRTALMLACDASHAKDTVYGEAIRTGVGAMTIGVSCRLCERQGCLSRAEAPLTRPLGLDEMVTGLSVFDFQ